MLMLKVAVRIEPFVGAVVAPLELEEILEAERIRILLECDALDLAFPFHSAATLAHARTCWNALAAARTALDSYEAMESFLIALYTPVARPMHLAQSLSLYRRSQRIVGHLPTIIARLDPTTPLPIAILGHLEGGNVEMAKRSLSVLYRHAAIHGAAILYEQQIQTPAVSHPPRGRPKKVPG